MILIKCVGVPLPTCARGHHKMATLGKGSSACMILNSYHKGLEYTLKEETGPPHSKSFVYAVQVEGMEYYGKGKSKKEAKQACAANALNKIHGIKVQLGTGVYEGGGEIICLCAFVHYI